MPFLNGPLLRRSRKRRLKSTGEVALAVGVAEGTLRNIESMRTVASDQVGFKLAEHLGISEDEVFNSPKPLSERGAA